MYTIKELLSTTHQTQTEINGKWVPARPELPDGLYGLKLRIKAAWSVLVGKTDTVIWPEGQ